MNNLQTKLLSTTAKLPARAHPQDAGLDLCYDGGVTLKSGCFSYPTGVAVSIPEGYVGLIWPRSGLTIKTGYDTLAGVIDAGYTGEIVVLVDKALDVKVGDKIAQLVIVPVALWDCVQVYEFTETERGDNGFGSTGV